MPYHVRHELPSVADYIAIRLAAGLSRKSEEAATRALPNSLFSVVVHHDGQPVGIGRVVGDGGCFYQVTDIAVVPAHQKRGVGDLIMRAIMEYLHTHAPKTAYVSLMAHHGTPQFYARYGFKHLALPPRRRHGLPHQLNKPLRSSKPRLAPPTWISTTPSPLTTT